MVYKHLNLEANNSKNSLNEKCKQPQMFSLKDAFQRAI
jgi:hypothetical protein